MKNNPRAFGITSQHIHNVTNDLRKSIDEKVSRNELEKHYATQSQIHKWVLVAGGALASVVLTLTGILVTGYFRLDSKIDNKFEKLDNKISDVITLEKRK